MISDLTVWLLVGALIWVAVTTVWKFALFCIAAGTILWLIGRTIDAIQASIRRTNEDRAAIAARADHQHNLILSGDEDGGTYGTYIPAPLN